MRLWYLWNCRGFGGSSFGRGGGRGNLRSFGGTQARGTLLRLGFPIGPAEARRSRHIPFTGILSVANGFEIAGKFKGDHGVAGFLEKSGELSSRIFAGACPSDACSDLLPVGHTVMAF